MDDPSPPLSLRQRTRHRGTLAASVALWLAYLAWRLVAARRGADPVMMTLDLAAESVLALGFLIYHASLVARPLSTTPWPGPHDEVDVPGAASAAADVVVTSDGGSDLELRAAVLAARRLPGVDRIFVIDPDANPGRRSIATSLDAAYLSGAPERELLAQATARGSSDLILIQWSRHVVAPWAIEVAGRSISRSPHAGGVLLASLPTASGRPAGRRGDRLVSPFASTSGADRPWIDQPVVMVRHALAHIGGFDPVETRLGTDLCLRATHRPLVPAAAPCYRDIAPSTWRSALLLAAESGRASRRVLRHHRLGWRLRGVPASARLTVWSWAITRAESAARLLFAGLVAAVAVTGRLPLVASAPELAVATIAVLGSAGLVSATTGSTGRRPFARWRAHAGRLGADLSPAPPRDPVRAAAILARRQASLLLVVVVLTAVAVLALYTPLHQHRPPTLARMVILVIAGLHLSISHSAQRSLRAARLDAPLQVDRSIDDSISADGPVLAVSPIGLLTDQSAPEDASEITVIWRAEDGSAQRRSVPARWADATDAEGRCWLLFDEPAVEVRDALLSYVSLGQAFEAAFGTEVLPSPIAIEIG